MCEIFYKVTAPLKKRRPDHGEVDDAYCITLSGYSDRDGVHGSFFLAVPKEGFDFFSEDDRKIGATQFGKCETCEAEVTSISKSAVCPICDSDVECT